MISEALDAQGASPHLDSMAKKDATPKPPVSPREAKLAQALRANLRRRKAVGAQPAPKPHKTSTD